MRQPLSQRVHDRTSSAHRIVHTAQQENRMTRSQSRSNKAPPRVKPAVVLPKLGTALNWVPPKSALDTQSRPKKRTPAP
ncbi:hypothetical protein CFB43_31640 [Burkholderia sp. AU15512]|nr:hypothetical protein CFB43_31640 [Burkholderia sp. AU15512]